MTRKCNFHNIQIYPLYNCTLQYTNDKKLQDYPCLCLCFGFSQIILILPFLLITLHFSQIGLTDDLTFIVKASFQTSSYSIITHLILVVQDFFYLSLQIIRPLLKSYGESSIFTLSPGSILM